MCTDKLLPLLAKAGKITNNKSHGKNIAEKLPSSTYALLNNYYWVLSIGNLLLTLKVHVRELFLKNYGLCPSLYWEITHAAVLFTHSCGGTTHALAQGLFTHPCGGTTHAMAQVLLMNSVWCPLAIISSVESKSDGLYTAKHCSCAYMKQCIVMWPLEETLCPLAII
jgi:hypothetical protein